MKLSINLCIILIAFVLISFTKSFSISRRKREAYNLPDGWDQLRNSLDTSFECHDDGYYADIANGCQLFHVCRFINLYFSKPRFLQYTFICGNGTVFNQLSQTCTYESQLTVPCESSAELFYMNKRIGAINTWFNSGEDYEKIRTVNNNNRFNSILSGAQIPPTLSNGIDEINGLDDDF